GGAGLMEKRFRVLLMNGGRPAKTKPLKAIQSWVPNTGVFSVSDLRGFFHAESGANDITRNRQTRARVMTRLLQGDGSVSRSSYLIQRHKHGIRTTVGVVIGGLERMREGVPSRVSAGRDRGFLTL